VIDHLLKDGVVPAVHTVEVADRHRGRPETRGDVAQIAPTLNRLALLHVPTVPGRPTELFATPSADHIWMTCVDEVVVRIVISQAVFQFGG
jgi:hypothetical protein